MLRLRRKYRAFSTVEYLVLIMILMGCLFIFKDYILRGLSGKWKSTGDQFGYSRQYDPTDTVECSYDELFNTHKWYDETCYENHNCPPGSRDCQRQAILNCQADPILDEFCNNR